MKQSLQLKLSQHLTLTPQLQQSIKLLQLSTIELNQELERYLLENPLLEREDTPPEQEVVGIPVSLSAEGAPIETSEPPSRDDAPSDEPRSNDDNYDDNFTFDSSVRRNGEDDEDSEYVQTPAAEPTLQQHLFSQLALISLSETDRKLASILIAHLDEDGYLPHDLAELFALISSEIEIEPEELSIALKYVQNLEPAGVGARSLAECLDLQLKTLPAHTPELARARQLVQNHLDILGARDFVKLKRVLRCNDAELKQIRELIVSLEPKPGRRFIASEIRYIIPDVIIKKTGGKWQAQLNRDAMPKLRVNKLYADLLQKNRDGDAKNLAGPLQEARWLIKNIQQRFDTILRVTQAIVEQQRHFFDHGEVAMRPLVLREIADQVGLHESTISRVTTQKYMLTPRGIFELKYFFGSSVSTDSGGACSATAIRALIKQLVQAEDVKKPLSDHRISDLLADQGIVVARRTIAKYRESLHIQSASQRKSF